MAKVMVVGAGVVGTATGQGFVHHGHDVTLVDSDPERVRTLIALGLTATAEIDLRGPSTFVFLALPTPAVAGLGYDLSAFVNGVSAVGAALRQATERHTVVVRSTVPPLTSDRTVVPLLENCSGRTCGHDFAVASAPEFLRAVSALQDVLSPWTTVLASRDDLALAELVELFRPFGGAMHTFYDPVIAEFIKVAHNAYNATKISFWNEMWQVSQELEIEADEVAMTVAYSAEGSTNPEYGIRGGFPYGGACLPKDVEGLLDLGRTIGVDLPLIRSVSLVNETIASLGSLSAHAADLEAMAAKSLSAEPEGSRS